MQQPVTPRVPTAPAGGLPGIKGRPGSHTSSSARSEPAMTPKATSGVRVATAPHKPSAPGPSPYLTTSRSSGAPKRPQAEKQTPGGPPYTSRGAALRAAPMRGTVAAVFNGAAGDVDPYDDGDDDIDSPFASPSAVPTTGQPAPPPVATSFDSPDSARSTPRRAGRGVAADQRASSSTRNGTFSPTASANRGRPGAASSSVVASISIRDELPPVDGLEPEPQRAGDGALSPPTMTLGDVPSSPAGRSANQGSPSAISGFRLPSMTTYDGKRVPPAVLIAQLDALRGTCVDNGRLLDAQLCLDEMTSLARRHGEHVARELKAKKSTDKAKRLLQEKHRTQLLKFTSLWEEKLQDYDSRAEEAVRSLRERRQREYEDLEDVIRTGLADQRPHFSSQVVSYRKEVDKLIRTSQYAEAHKAKQMLDAMISREEARFEELTSIRFAQQTRTLKRKFVAEVRALRMRVAGDREQLVGQRQNDYDTLLQRQANEILAFEQRVKTQKAKALRDIDRRLAAMGASSGGGSTSAGAGRSNFDLDALDRIAENALADLVGPVAHEEHDGSQCA